MTAKSKEIKKIPAAANFAVLDINQIDLSPFEPQEHRRKRFTNEELSDLGANIKQHGQIQPITVRPVGDRYQLVAGERRLLAHRVVGLETIEAIVKELSDEAALEVQLSENLNRKDPDPLDEAFCYQFLMDKFGLTVLDLSIKFSKSENSIRQRLAMNKLIPEVLDDIAKGFLPLGHAMEICKFRPEQQLQVLNQAYNKSWPAKKPKKEELRTLAVFKQQVREQVLLSLSAAKFDTKSTELRPDGLACAQCPERTGAAGELFAEFHDKKNDRCLNVACFQAKTIRHFHLKREKESAKQIKAGKLAPGELIPAILYYGYDTKQYEKQFGIKGVITDKVYRRNYDEKDLCEFAEAAIHVESQNFCKIWYICRSPKCKTHKSSSSSSSLSPSPEKAAAEKAKRNQDILDVKVQEPIRAVVIKQAALTFNAENRLVNNEEWFVRLLVKIREGLDSRNRQMIDEILGDKKPDELTPDEREQFLFIAITANLGEMDLVYKFYRDQKPIRKIAEEFGINYQKLDAANRLAAAPKKYRSAAQEYFDKTEAGEKLERPIFYKVDKPEKTEKSKKK